MVKSMTARISGVYQLWIVTDALMQTATVGQMTTTHSTWIQHNGPMKMGMGTVMNPADSKPMIA